MLFSRDEVARFINAHFEPAWESVRPVPLIRIDFGNGNVITRTLHGNIATYVCSAEGQVLDILPGIYQPATYLERLNQFRLLGQYAGLKKGDARATLVKQYHQNQEQSRQGKDVSERSVEGRSYAITAVEKPAAIPVPPTKRVIELPTERLVGARSATVARPPESKGSGESRTAAVPALGSADELANWKLLEEDTRINESQRRRLIHDMLASTGLVRPREITRRLYKNVLNADLDDPYLGLGKELFSNYPFTKEEKPR